MPPESMTPLDACDLFTAMCQRIDSAGISICGINVGAVEFHVRNPPPTTPIAPLTPTGPTPGTAAALPPPATLAWTSLKAPNSAAAQGEVCVGCGGSNLRWSGYCKTCLDCGTAGGCG